MPFIIQDNFQLNAARPLDTRMVATNSTARNEINPLVRYDGMKVFQLDDRQTYVWNGTVSGSWSLESSGSVTGTGSSGFLTQWNSSTVIGSSIIYNMINGTLNGLPVGFVGINTPASGNLQPRESLQVNSPQNSSPPFVVHKGGTTILGENWYFTSTEQNFQVDRGSSLIQFDNGSVNFRVRAANQSPTTLQKLNINSNRILARGAEIELALFEGGTPQPGTVIGSIVARSLEYSWNLSAIKFLSDGSWSGGQYPTSTVFYSMAQSSQIRAMTIKPNGNVIIGATSGSVGEKLLVEGDLRVQNVINFGPYSTPSYNRTGYIWSATDNLQINRQTNHPINLATNNINRVRIEATGELSPLFGVGFQPTQIGERTSGVVSSTQSNTLSDYEEGTININNFINLYRQISNPQSILFGSAGGTSTGNIKYVKVGKAVTISGWMILNWTAINGTTHGARTVEFNLPFAPSSNSEGGIGVHLVCPQWTVSSVSPYGGTICIQSLSGNPVILTYHKFGSSTGNPTVNHFKSLNSGICDIHLTFTYIANS